MPILNATKITSIDVMRANMRAGKILIFKKLPS